MSHILHTIGVLGAACHVCFTQHGLVWRGGGGGAYHIKVCVVCKVNSKERGGKGEGLTWRWCMTKAEVSAWALLTSCSRACMRPTTRRTACNQHQHHCPLIICLMPGHQLLIHPHACLRGDHMSTHPPCKPNAPHHIFPRYTIMLPDSSISHALYMHPTGTPQASMHAARCKPKHS